MGFMPPLGNALHTQTHFTLWLPFSLPLFIRCCGIEKYFVPSRQKEYLKNLERDISTHLIKPPNAEMENFDVVSLLNLLVWSQETDHKLYLHDILGAIT